MPARWMLLCLLLPLGSIAIRAQTDDALTEGLPSQRGASDDLAASDPSEPVPDVFAGLPSGSPELDELASRIEALRLRGRYAEAAHLAREGAERALTNLPTARGRFLYLQGRVQWSLDNFPEAISTLIEALRSSEQGGDLRVLPMFHTALGTAYLDSRQWEASLRHHTLALELAEREGDPARVSNALNHLGNYHLALRDNAKARAFHERALKLREAASLTIGTADSLTNLGTIALNTGDPTSALEHYGRALKVYEAAGLRRHIANSHRRIAAALRRLGRTEEAVGRLRTAIEIAEALGSQAVLAPIYSELARVHEARGELRSALLYQRRQAAARETILDERTRQRVAELNARYEADRRQLEIEMLRREQEGVAERLARERNEKLVLAGVLVLGLGATVAILFLQRARLRSEREARVITEAARAEAEQAVRLKSRLLQIAAHDLKAPLAAVSATAGRIEEAPQAAPQVAHFARLIRTDAARMASLVREFLDSAAIEAGRIQLHRAEVDMLSICQAAVEDFQALAEAKGQDLRLILPEEIPPPALADPERLRQVLDNLITNALKFSPRTGTVLVVPGTSGRWTQVEVRDSGPGLTPEDLGKLFQPFQALSAAPTASETSSGLGLFITRELVSMQDGMLEVESQPGQGALFRVLLPSAMPTGE